MIIKLLLSFCLILTLHGCGGAPMHPPILPAGIPLQDICGRYQVQWQWDPVTQVVLLEYKGNKAKALVGSSTVVLGQEKINLSAPIRRDHSSIFVPEDFESKVLGTFGVSIGGLPRADMSSSRVRTVVVDAGHGGKDSGAQGYGIIEKEVTLDISKRLKALLEDAGMKVVMTRESDKFISLPERTEITTASKADLFVSVHVNTNPSRKINGLMAYYVNTQRKFDLNEEQRSKNECSYVRSLNAAPHSNLQSIVADMMYTSKVAHSEKFAKMIIQETAKKSGIYNRGIRVCRFFVVRNSLIPAVLVETGFLTNPDERRKLKTSAYRQKLAEVMARSILDYANN